MLYFSVQKCAEVRAEGRILRPEYIGVFMDILLLFAQHPRSRTQEAIGVSPKAIHVFPKAIGVSPKAIDVSPKAIVPDPEIYELGPH